MSGCLTWRGWWFTTCLIIMVRMTTHGRPRALLQVRGVEENTTVLEFLVVEGHDEWVSAGCSLYKQTTTTITVLLLRPFQPTKRSQFNKQLLSLFIGNDNNNNNLLATPVLCSSIHPCINSPSNISSCWFQLELSLGSSRNVACCFYFAFASSANSAVVMCPLTGACWAWCLEASAWCFKWNYY